MRAALTRIIEAIGDLRTQIVQKQDRGDGGRPLGSGLARLNV